jgi:tripartite-type tricarboxylate transporter receptor subunit TctC
MTDVLGGRVDMIFGTAAGVAGFISNGRVWPLAVTSAQRSPSLPDVATVAETVPGYWVESWYGVYAPAGTPVDVIARLNAAIGQVARSEDFRKRVEPEGIMVSAGSPSELDEYVRAQEALWHRIVEENKIKPD